VFTARYGLDIHTRIECRFIFALGGLAYSRSVYAVMLHHTCYTTLENSSKIDKDSPKQATALFRYRAAMMWTLSVLDCAGCWSGSTVLQRTAREDTGLTAVRA
jgi:hypothetical protein